MVSSQTIVVMALLIATLVSVDAENFFSRRRSQKSQPFQRFNTNSYFRQRLGTQVNWLNQILIGLLLIPFLVSLKIKGSSANNYPLASPLLQPQTTGANLATSSYGGATTYGIILHNDSELIRM